ncbi:MAG: AmmeMemoRadiSam system protein A [Myxococcales bacterium]|nr:AmmeMemoRadiSam system protein A [Myxococcales bacterium]
MKWLLTASAAALAACGSCQRQSGTDAGVASSAPKVVRPPAAVGSFYPAEAPALQAEVRRHLESAKKIAAAPVRMVLAPHAGLSYSGRIAADAFKQLEPGFERVVIVAANHDGAHHFAGISVDRSTHYRVPGLEVPVARAAAELLSRPGFVDLPAVHGMHMVEIELPFLRAVGSGPFEIVPLIAGSLGHDQIRLAARELSRLADPKTAFVFSVDLSHYYPYEVAQGLDRPCLDALARSDAVEVAKCDTDGTQVLLLMNELASIRALTPRLISYANSGDTSGEKSRVVGYGAIAYEERFELSAAEGNALVELAKRALGARVREGKEIDVPPELTARFRRLTTPRGAFVTLTKEGQLRGCIGSLSPIQPLALDVVRNTVNAAVSDPRFPPVKPEELGSLSLSISVLDLPKPLEGVPAAQLPSHLAQSKPGLILEYGGRRSTFLPQVWEELPDPVEFLSHLCAKQGSPLECWREPAAKYQSYAVQYLGDEH